MSQFSRRRFAWRRVAALLACGLLIAASAAADPKRHGRGDDYDDDDRRGLRYDRDHGGRTGERRSGGVNIAAAVIFGSGDRGIIESYYRSQPVGALPPGLAKKGSLPPGHAKRLRRKGSLPPGIEKQIYAFPPDLEARMAPLPRGCDCERGFVDGRAVIFNRGTRVVLDVFVPLGGR